MIDFMGFLGGVEKKVGNGMTNKRTGQSLIGIKKRERLRWNP